MAALPTGEADLCSLSPGPAGKAALHWAVEGLPARAAERLQVVRWLLDRGADMNQRSRDGRTPFQHACRDGWDRALLDLLLTRGAAIDAADTKKSSARSSSETALHRAAERRDVELITYLLEKKANPRGVSLGDRETPLHRVFSRATSLESEKTRSRTLSCARLLLAAGAPPDAANSRGRTVLHEAANCSNFEGIKELLSHGASIDAQTADGSSAMHCAVMNRATFDRRVIDCLHSRAVDLLNATDKQGNTPLHVAVAQSNDEAVQTLLLLGADSLVRNKRGQRPIDLQKHLNQPTSEMLRKYTPPETEPEPVPAPKRTEPIVA